MHVPLKNQGKDPCKTGKKAGSPTSLFPVGGAALPFPSEGAERSLQGRLVVADKHGALAGQRVEFWPQLQRPLERGASRRGGRADLDDVTERPGSDGADVTVYLSA